MASTTTDGNLAVYVDAAVGAVAKLRAPAMALHGIGHEQTSVGRNTCLQYHHAVRAYGRVKLVTRSVGEQDSAADG